MSILVLVPRAWGVVVLVTLLMNCCDCHPSTPLMLINSTSISPSDVIAAASGGRNDTAPPTRNVDCFTPSSMEHASPTTVDNCAWALEWLLRKDFPDPFAVQKFARKPAPGGYYEVPAEWIAADPKETSGAFPCRVVLSSDEKRDRDEFRLLDVGLAV